VRIPVKWIIILVVLAAGVYWFLKTRPSTSYNKRSVAQRSAPKSKAVGKEFHGISIEFDEDTACDAVKALANQRLLSNAVPPLPVVGCTSTNCQCKYIHHDDRRGEDDNRRLVGSLQWQLSETSSRQERRNTKGRRKLDR
jgi:hypothetical protein